MTDAYFDLETTGLGPDDAITVGVVKVVDGNNSTHHVFHSGHGKTIEPTDAERIVDTLQACKNVYSFNGAAFDFKMLAAAAPARTVDIVRLALGHRDVMYDFAVHHGYYAAMSSFVGSPVEKSNNGKWAATAWFDSDCDAVIEYCKTDVDVLHGLVSMAMDTGYMERVAKTSGRTTRWSLEGAADANPHIQTVADALEQVKAFPPKTSWMTDPPDLTSVVAWSL
jgi:hypothetical protein